jgi:phospholipid transport system substrate-binding protein
MSNAAMAWLMVVATAVSPAAPHVVVQSSIRQVVRLLRDPELSRPANAEKRRTEIHRVAASLFDYPEMARRALARRWGGYPARERAEFIRLFAGRFEQSYVGKFQAYASDQIVYQGESIDQAAAAVRTKIVTASEGEIPVEYRLSRVGARWAVYDVLIGGVSLIASYRSEFNRAIETESFASLLQRLRQAESPAVATPGTPDRTPADASRPTPPPENEIREFRLAEGSGREMNVAVAYTYAGDHGQDDVFLHAGALLGEELGSRVPGTNFPGEPVSSGRGSVTLTITKTRVDDTGTFTSRTLRACLVSLRTRSVFLCRNFPLVHEWD